MPDRQRREVERVARRLQASVRKSRAARGEKDWPWADLPDANKDDWRDVARLFLREQSVLLLRARKGSR